MNTHGARSAASWFGSFLLTLATWLMASAVCAQSVQPVPALTAHVMDRTGTLQPQQVAALEAKLVQLEASKEIGRAHV